MVKMHKKYSQKLYLFIIYGSFILILLGIFFAFTYTHYRTNAIEEAKKDSENLCVSVASAVQSQLDHLSTISMNIVYSNAIKTNFKEFSNYYQETGRDPAALVASREKAMAIHDIVTAIIGAYQTASDIKLYTMDGSCVEAGYCLRTSKVVLEEQAWYSEVMGLNGHKYITVPMVNEELPAKNSRKEEQKYISLIRLFLDSGGKPEGIVEVIQDCGEIFSLVSQLRQTNPDCQAFLYNNRGERMYPYHGSWNVDYAKIIDGESIKELDGCMVRCGDKEDMLLTWKQLPDYGWSVVIAKTKDTVYQPLKNYQRMFVGIGISSIFFTMMICFSISEQLTKPLQKLTDAAGKITINRVLAEDKVNLTSADSRIREVALLCESIRSMYDKLRATSQEVLLSRSEETKAMLQATQSVINPHFLYNSLTNISVMAEEEMNEDIVKLCQALCDYFRYISSGQEMIVPLEKEIFYTKRYLECMQLRFGEELEYELQIEEKTRQYYIPKLILQPIVENAFKYAFVNSPPWRLAITALTERDKWILRVQDNGGRMADAKKQELIKLFQNLDLKEELKSLQIGGMGLKNVYLRLRLLYGEKAVFKIENSYPGRTIFILGGPIYNTKEEYQNEHPQL